jgi:hypothetical protein
MAVVCAQEVFSDVTEHGPRCGGVVVVQVLLELLLVPPVLELLRGDGMLMVDAS